MTDVGEPRPLGAVPPLSRWSWVVLRKQAEQVMRNKIVCNVPPHSLLQFLSCLPFMVDCELEVAFITVVVCMRLAPMGLCLNALSQFTELLEKD